MRDSIAYVSYVAWVVTFVLLTVILIGWLMGGCRQTMYHSILSVAVGEEVA